MRRGVSSLAQALMAICCLCSATPAISAESVVLACGPFADVALAPQPRELTRPPQRVADIAAAAGTQPFTVVFLGDSLTQLWDREVWQRYFAPLPALNAGVGGDRTDHLLARLQNGMLDNQHSGLVVLLIGANDLTYGRSPDVVAEGVRTLLLDLRRRLPSSLILLEGLWPRDDQPGMRQAAEEVNRRLARCAGGAVLYADFSAALLAPSGELLSDAYTPDKLHLNRTGYDRVSPPIYRKVVELLQSGKAR